MLPNPWDKNFHETNKIKLVIGEGEIQHYGDFACEAVGARIDLPPPTAQEEAVGKLNVFTGVLTYSDKAIGVRKTPEQIERIRRNYISSQTNLLCGTLSDKFKTAKSAAAIFKYVDEELEDTKYWTFDDKNNLVNDVTYSIRRIREEQKTKK